MGFQSICETISSQATSWTETESIVLQDFQLHSVRIAHWHSVETIDATAEGDFLANRLSLSQSMEQGWEL